jgi:hypothetical protein
VVQHGASTHPDMCRVSWGQSAQSSQTTTREVSFALLSVNGHPINSAECSIQHRSVACLECIIDGSCCTTCAWETSCMYVNTKVIVCLDVYQAALMRRRTPKHHLEQIQNFSGLTTKQFCIADQNRLLTLSSTVLQQSLLQKKPSF